MQSRLATIARRSTSFFSSQSQCLLRRGLASSTNKRTADPSVHAVDFGDDVAIFSGSPEETQNVAEPNPAKQQTKAEYKSSNGSENDPISPPKYPHATSSRLHSSGVNHPFDPTLQQKRSYGATTGFENVSCVGFDGTPNDKNENQRNRSGVGAQQKHDKDFFNKHKASETEELVDTRKPITRSKEGPAYYSLAKDVFGWKPEQLDSADGALKRARKLFEESEKRGVPEHPQSKVLRELRGESF